MLRMTSECYHLRRFIHHVYLSGEVRSGELLGRDTLTDRVL